MRRATPMMDDVIEFPGFPSIHTTRGFAYQWLKDCGWLESETGYGSLDYIVFVKPAITTNPTPASIRDSFLNQVRTDYLR